MEKLYQVLEAIRDTIVDKVANYDVKRVYKTVVYAATYAALQKRLNQFDILKPLEESIPAPLRATARRELVDMFHSLFKHVDSYLSSPRPVVVNGEADLNYLVEQIRREVDEVDYVLAYDCMSIIEFVVISAYLESRGVRTLFLSKPFLNPLGLTRFMTHQLEGPLKTLRGVAHYIAERLNALLESKNSYIDQLVHDTGILGLDAFVEKVNIEKIADEIDTKARGVRVLVFSDHGYDIVLSHQGSYIYVTHGFRQTGTFGDIPLLLLSRITVFMEAYSTGYKLWRYTTSLPTT